MGIYRPSTIPANGINHELLQAELAQLGNIGLSTDAEGWRVDIFAEGVSDSAVQAVIDAHDATVLTDEQKVRDAAVVALEQGKTYLRTQLLNASPNVGDIYSTVKAAVDGNVYLAQVVSNQIALMSNSFGWTLNLETPNATDRQRYILAVEMVVALLT